MSSSPPETETIDADLSRDERWVVHYVLSIRADDAIDESETLPSWVFELFETIESGEATLTRYQARKLHDALTTYAMDDETPDRDVVDAVAVTEQLEARLDA